MLGVRIVGNNNASVCLLREVELKPFCITLHLFISDGQFFTWGKNSHGQLGLGKEFPSQASPQRVRSLEGIPLAQVAAGGAHSFALSLSGAVFGWGMNNAGQLGLSDDEGR